MLMVFLTFAALGPCADSVVALAFFSGLPSLFYMGVTSAVELDPYFCADSKLLTSYLAGVLVFFLLLRLRSGVC